MSEETIPELAQRMMTDYGFPFLLGWLLGAGLGQQMWDSITGVI